MCVFIWSYMPMYSMPTSVQSYAPTNNVMLPTHASAFIWPPFSYLARLSPFFACTYPFSLNCSQSNPKSSHIFYHKLYNWIIVTLSQSWIAVFNCISFMIHICFVNFLCPIRKLNESYLHEWCAYLFSNIHSYLLLEDAYPRPAE